MLVGIHVNIRGTILPFTRKYIEVLEHNQIGYKLMNVQDDSFWQDYSKLDAFIFQIGQSSDILQISGSFLPLLHQYSSTPVYPDGPTSWHYDDKIRQHYLAKFHRLEFVESRVFWEKRKALDWLAECSFPVVCKLKGGAGSTNVALVKKPAQAKKIINRAFGPGIADSSLGANWKVKYFPLRKFVRTSLIRIKRSLLNEDPSAYWAINKNYWYLQKYLLGNEFDTRVTVIGNRAFAYRRFNRKGDFRASGSGKNDYDSTQIDLRMVRAALEISHKCGFQCMAYDFLYDGDFPKICEISYTYVDRFIYNCQGYWDNDLLWHPGHCMPQLFILEDLLQISLQQPEWDI